MRRRADEHHGEQVLKSLREGRQLAVFPGEAIPMGRCWRALIEEADYSEGTRQTLLPAAVFDLPRTTPGVK